MRREYIVGIILAVLVGVGLMYLFTRPARDSLVSDMGMKTERYKEIVDPSGFVNIDNVAIGDLVGKKVILVDFMTYSCINCQRTFPYVTAWYSKYKDQGLEIVGIHTPEFAFEKDIDNVCEAMQQHGIEYPVVLDNNYGTWRAYGNQYWPRKYLIDIHGNIVYDHIGEGAYEETEKKIQELLKERAIVLGEKSTSFDESLAAARMPEESREVGSPEIYFGSLRNERLGNGERSLAGEQVFALPVSPQRNTLYLGGKWDIREEYAKNIGEGRIVFTYVSKNVYMVAASDAGPVNVDVFRDGKFLKTVEVKNEGLYSLVEGESSGESVLELRIRDSGLNIFTFTFG